MADQKPQEDSPLVAHAKRELRLSGADSDEVYGGMIGEAVIALIELYSSQGHSGASASLTASLFYGLAQFKALTPLTDDPEEWMDVSETMYTKEQLAEGKKCWQNIRQSSAFSYDGGKTYKDIDSKESGTTVSKESNGKETEQGKPSSSSSTSGSETGEHTEAVPQGSAESTTKPQSSPSTDEGIKPERVGEQHGQPASTERRNHRKRKPRQKGSSKGGAPRRAPEEAGGQA